MLGQSMSVPIFCAPAAMAKMVHPDGEKALARGCRAQGIPGCISTNASYPFGEIIEAASEPGPYGDFEGDIVMPLFFQLYVNRDRKISEALVKTITAQGRRPYF